MSYLLDTCIISKLRRIKNQSHGPFYEWILSHSETNYYLSILTIGEIQYGISKLDAHEETKKMVFEDWLLGDLIPRFNNRILVLDAHTASIWGTMRGEAAKKGRLLPVVDSLIAATAVQHNLILVTENTKDFIHTGAHLINPNEAY